MSLVINHNMMATNASRNLNSHYAGLSTSVRRLSSGLRVGTSADDAAGLAIRELMRADIAALNQGVRNANDAISMIQTADGALGIIDEKLIRMKELSEQAATGTYNSDQRLMIDSEFQAMKAEIDRIAMATDFNGVKILCNDSANKMVTYESSLISVGYGKTSGYVQPIFETKIINPAALNGESAEFSIESNGFLNIIAQSGDPKIFNWTGYFIDESTWQPLVGEFTLKFTASSQSWEILNHNGPGEMFEFCSPDISSNTSAMLVACDDGTFNNVTGPVIYMDRSYFYDKNGNPVDNALTEDVTITVSAPQMNSNSYRIKSNNPQFASANVLSVIHNEPAIGSPGDSITEFHIDVDGDGKVDIIQTATIKRPNDLYPVNSPYIRKFSLSVSGSAVTKIHFGPGNDPAEDYYYIETRDCTAKGLGIDKTTIETQDKAQNALGELNQAIIKKDTARAYFGAMQNRLENTVSNLQIQAENLQAAESRISDVDVATEMPEFIRMQVLTQAAIAMLSQANSLPQMALQLLQV